MLGSTVPLNILRLGSAILSSTHQYSSFSFLFPLLHPPVLLVSVSVCNMNRLYQCWCAGSLDVGAELGCWLGPLESGGAGGKGEGNEVRRDALVQALSLLLARLGESRAAGQVLLSGDEGEKVSQLRQGPIDAQSETNTLSQPNTFMVTSHSHSLLTTCTSARLCDITPLENHTHRLIQHCSTGL